MSSTQEITAPTELLVQSGVNEANFFKSMKHLFATSFSVLGELMQNSRRAGATRIDFQVNIKNKTIAIFDDGCGITDFSKLIQLCESNWDEQTMLTDKPFGMGFFSVFYACEKVIIRSNGHMLTASLDDIVSKRTLKLEPDPAAFNLGTIIELLGVSDKLIEPHNPHIPRDSRCMSAHRIGTRLRDNAYGFPIAVSLNGEELPRPHAQAQLEGEHSSVGFMQIDHVHKPGMNLPSLRHYASELTLYLQGLPIEEKRNGHAGVIVHLDSNRFIAKMPDRSHLYDSAEQLKLIHQEKVAIVKRFLVTQKSKLTGEDFVLKYWDACLDYEVTELLNDIPFIPGKVLSYLETITEDVYNRWSSGPDSPKLVSRNDILSGEVKVWRNAPDDYSDSDDALVLQKVMQRDDICCANNLGVDKEHWIHQCTPSCEDFVVLVEPVNPKGVAHYSLNDFDCTIRMADSIQIVITSKVDSAYRFEHAITQDWVIQKLNSGDVGDHDVVCYVTADDDSNDWPVTAFSSFMDENDQHREEWENDAVDEWKGLIASLKGSSLTVLIEMGLDKRPSGLTEQHLGQMTLLRTVTNWNNHHKAFDAPSIEPVDLDDTKFWKSMAKKLAREMLISGSHKITASSLQKAFAATAKSGEKIGAPKGKDSKKK